MYALLFLSYADYYLPGPSDKALIDKLSQAKSDFATSLSLIEIAKARYWEHKNKKEYEKCLINSIILCKTHVANYVLLAEFYVEQKKINQSIPLIKQAIINRNDLWAKSKNNVSSPTNINDLLREFFINFGISDHLRSLVKEYDKAN